MAKTLQDYLIKLGIDGIDELKQLKGSLRQLSQVTRSSDKDLDKLAAGIKNYSRVVGRSEKTLRGQITALKGLREQAQLGGASYIKLTRDIERYEKRLQSVGKTAVGTAEKLSTVNQVLNAQIPARKPAAFGRQIAALNKELSDLSVTSDDYLKILRQIQERELAFGKAQARQAVIGRAATVAEGPVDKRTFFQLDKSLPNTTRALNLRLSELQETLVDTNISSERYRNTQREIVEIEKRLADATNQRIEAIKGVTEQQRRAEQLAERSRGRKQRLLANQAAADAEYNAALGAHIAAPAMPARQLSSLYQSISQISAAGMAREVEMMGNSYRKVAADINLAARAGGNSISSLQGQRVAFDSLRNVLDPTSREFRQVSKQIQILDKRLGKLTQTSNRFSKANLAQGAGAIASAGIFGGPLGALGAGAGFALGGPAGAVVGAGFGAVADSIRQQLAQLAEYTTQLNLAKQTLALAANGQEEYNKLLKTARSISQDYAISLKETIGGFSQVAVAARANNLTLEETETIFRGLVSAGIAFGKSQQDIDAIVRATVQVLSKGKLSAEELQGQIGERLPGAVAKFAEATGRSLPQLAKDLKAGTVEISDFVDFSRKNLLDYDKVAQLIADGPEKAGARLKLALDESVENFGGFFLRVGAGFQDLFKGIVDFANDNVDVIQNMIVDFIIAAEKIQLTFATLAVNIQKTLGPVLSGIVGLFGRGVDAIYEGVQRERELQAGGFDAQKALENARESAKNVVGFLGELHPGYQKALEEAYDVEVRSALFKGRKRLKGTELGRVDDSAERREQIKEQFGFKPFAYGDYRTGQTLPGSGSEADKDGAAPVKDIDAATRDALIAQLGLRERGLELTRQQIEEAARLAREAANLLPPNKRLVELEKIRISTSNQLFRLQEAQSREAQEAFRLQQRVNQAYEQAKRPIERIVERVKDKINGEKMYERLLARGINPELAKELVNLEKVFKASLRTLDARIANLKAEKAITKLGDERLQQIEDEIEALERRKKALEGDKKKAEGGLKETVKEKPLHEKIEDEIGVLQDELNKLVDPANQIILAAKAIGSAFKQSFMDLITGASTAKEALAGFFKSIGEHFLEMAAEIIAKQIVLITLQTIFNALSSAGLGTADFSGGGASAGPPKGFKTTMMAEGGYLSGGFRKFADGGSVNKPTLGLVGEGGESEYIIPESKMRESMKRYSRGARGSAVIPTERGAISAEMESGAVGAGAIDVRYTVERINNVDYVTADQFQQGMQRAAAEGAARGEQQTLRKLQMSGSTRRRLGM